MKVRRQIAAAAVVLASVIVANAGAPVQLSEEEFKANGSARGVVVVQINWGRKWHCADLENAQLEKLTFSLWPDATSGMGDTLELETPSRLLVKDAFTPYALVVTPGRYALTGFDVKIARSVSDVQHIVGSQEQLIVNNEALGGSFNVSAGEIVYIGHIGLDCKKEAVPWRYYVERNDFDRYVEGFRKHFPFVGDKPVTYRLLATKLYGQEAEGAGSDASGK